MRFKTTPISKTGGREINQDYCGWLEIGKNCCWVVADGLGGHRGGEIASRTAVTAALESFRRRPELSREALEQHIVSAQACILKLQLQDSELKGMRTTIVILASDSRHFLWAHVGDSRLYYFHRNRIAAQTQDHSVPQMMALARDITPDQIRFHPDRNRVLRCLGEKGETRPDIPSKKGRLRRGDAFLLCTDGFWEFVTESEMEVDLAEAETPVAWLERAEARLLARATDEHDNYSAIAVFHARKEPLWRWLWPEWSWRFVARKGEPQNDLEVGPVVGNAAARFSTPTTNELDGDTQ